MRGLSRAAAFCVFSSLMFACSSSTTPSDSGNPDSGTSHDAGPTGPITTVATGIALPAPYTSSNPADFGSSNDGGAAAYNGALVEFMGAVTSQGVGSDAGCPAALTYQTHCDGFQANATGGNFLVDTYIYANDPTACSSLNNAASITNVRGIWYNDFGAWTIGITGCSDIGMGSGYAGTGTAPATPAGSTTVAAMLAGNPTDGQKVTVSGVVTFMINADGADYTFGLEDPAGGARSGVTVFASQTDAGWVVPNVGDYDTVSGPWSVQYGQISL